jgi:hypothetical protein
MGNQESKTAGKGIPDQDLLSITLIVPYLSLKYSLRISSSLVLSTMFFIQNKSVEYHICASLLRSIASSLLISTGCRIVTELDDGFMMMPFAVAAFCFLRLCYEDYREIRNRFLETHIGLQYLQMLILAHLMMTNLYKLLSGRYDCASGKSLFIGATLLPGIASLVLAWNIAWTINKLTKEHREPVLDEKKGTTATSYMEY